MPYIDKNQRGRALIAPRGPSELDYLLTMCILEYLSRNEYCFATMNEIIGVLEKVDRLMWTEFMRKRFGLRQRKSTMPVPVQWIQPAKGVMK